VRLSEKPPPRAAEPHTPRRPRSRAPTSSTKTVIVSFTVPNTNAPGQFASTADQSAPGKISFQRTNGAAIFPIARNTQPITIKFTTHYEYTALNARSHAPGPGL
jgi:hypothetical protein